MVSNSNIGSQRSVYRNNSLDGKFSRPIDWHKVPYNDIDRDYFEAFRIALMCYVAFPVNALKALFKIHRELFTDKHPKGGFLIAGIESFAAVLALLGVKDGSVPWLVKFLKDTFTDPIRLGIAAVTGLVSFYFSKKKCPMYDQPKKVPPKK